MMTNGTFFGSNNTRSFSPITHRLPRFEYFSPPFAYTERLEGAPCEDYPYDRRNLSEQFEEETEE